MESHYHIADLLSFIVANGGVREGIIVYMRMGRFFFLPPFDGALANRIEKETSNDRDFAC